MTTKNSLPAVSPSEWVINGNASPSTTLARLKRKAERIAANNPGQSYSEVLAQLRREYGKVLTLPEE